MNDCALLIEKLIKMTKDNSLCWVHCNKSNIALKPLPTSPLNLDSHPRFSSKDLSTLKLNESYVCNYEHGYFFLLLYQSPFRDSLSLRVQTDTAEYSRVYISTDETDEVNIISQLKRLYNLISSTQSTEDIDVFINDFIKGE